MRWLSIISLLSSALFLVPVNLYSQVFLAGQHVPGNYYHDIVPDTTLTGPYVHAQTIPPATYHIDINNDGINDVVFSAWGEWYNGLTDSEVSIRVYDTVACQVAFGYTDLCPDLQGDTLAYNMVKFLKSNDTIGNNLLWRSQKQYLCYQTWALMYHNCNTNVFPDDPGGNFLAVRLIVPSDTIYGWIRVSNIQFLTYTVQAFACSKNYTGIDKQSSFVQFWPNPARDVVVVETRAPGAKLIIYDQFGRQLFEKQLLSAKTEIDLRAYARGLYVFKLLSRDNPIYTGKIIKL
jgi:hypothetical protein